MKYVSAPQIPSTIPCRQNLPPRRTYDQIVSALGSIALDTLRTDAKREWDQATPGYKAGFTDEETGIRRLIEDRDARIALMLHQEQRAQSF